jgi:hypothetical protein
LTVEQGVGLPQKIWEGEKTMERWLLLVLEKEEVL